MIKPKTFWNQHTGTRLLNYSKKQWFWSIIYCDKSLICQISSFYGLLKNFFVCRWYPLTLKKSQFKKLHKYIKKSSSQGLIVAWLVGVLTTKAVSQEQLSIPAGPQLPQWDISGCRQGLKEAQTAADSHTSGEMLGLHTQN